MGEASAGLLTPAVALLFGERLSAANSVGVVLCVAALLLLI